MIRNRLKEMELKISDLADYLQVSRTTLYSAIDAYDQGKKDSVSSKVLKLFDYLSQNPLAGKKNAISFILSHMSGEMEKFDNERDLPISPIMKYLADNPTSSKSRFLELAIQTTDFDSILEYLLRVYPLLRNRRLTEAEIEFIKPYDDIRNIIDNKKED